MSKRIKYLDGFRGVACTTVFLGHFITCFLPGYLDVDKLQKIPFYALLNGNVSVRYFFVLCGFTVALQILNGRKTCGVIIKKYSRLMIPCLVINIIVYMLMKLGLYYNLEASKLIYGAGGHLAESNLFEPKLINIFVESFLTDMFVPLKVKNIRLMFVSVLWTMAYEMIGTIVICISMFISKKLKNKLSSKTIILLYVIAVLFFAATSEIVVNTYFQYFFIGMIFSEMVVNYNIQEKRTRNIYVLILLLISMCLIQNVVDNGVIKGLFYALGEAMLMFCIFTNKTIQDIGNSKVLSFLGKQSLSIYICHWPIYMTIISFIAVLMFSNDNGSVISKFILLFVSAAVITIISAMLMTKIINYIMGQVNKVLNKFI